MKLQKFNRTLIGAMVISGAMGIASQAHALSITPVDADWFTNSTSNLTTAADIFAVTGISGLGLAYKMDYDSTEEGGNAKDYYSTTFMLDSDMEPVGATITQAGSMWMACPTCVLVVKDGNQGNPAQYLFNLGNWDGKETITLSGFWDGTPGAISNVAIWNIASNGGGSLVPEADTYAMLLAGLGLVGFAARRKLA